MDIYRLASDLKFANQLGATLNIEERFVNVVYRINLIP